MFCFFTVQTIDKLERDRLLLFLNALIKHKVAVYFHFFDFSVFGEVPFFFLIFALCTLSYCDRSATVG